MFPLMSIQAQETENGLHISFYKPVSLLASLFSSYILLAILA